VIASLSARLLLAVSLLLLVFFGITIALLAVAFRDAAERAIHERLDVQLIVLLAAAEADANGAITMPETLPEPRFSTPGSGLYGEIVTPEGERIWRSPSLVGRALRETVPDAPGRSMFGRATTADGEAVFAISILVEFDVAGASARPLVFTVAETFAPFREDVARFRKQLLGWFGLLTVVLLGAQALLMRVLLRPLRRVEREIVEIESGARTELGRGYPTELRGVTENLNALLAGERARLERYRRTLGNLAHSLKTPLAVMRTALEGRARDDTLVAQVERMNDIVGYQLQRAAAWGGGTTLGRAPIAAGEVVAQLADALRKVYADKAVQLTADVSPDARFYGEQGDLLELLGNLLDNAFKWCRSRVVLTVSPLAHSEGRRPGLVLVVDDDGPGVQEADRARVLERGVRADESTPGHGIGLAVVDDIARLHGGSVVIGRSPLGGARVEVRLPAG
jgi:two-component system, OmpR family, sensor histidine kinase PhoQ